MPGVPYTKTAIAPAAVPAPSPAEVEAARSARLLDTLCRRLEALGATPDEVAGVRQGWDVFDEEWTPDARLRLATAPDAVLIAHLRQGRTEYVEALKTDEEVEVDRLEGIEEEAKREAQDHAGKSVAEVLAWVKGAGTEDQYLARSFAVVLLETGFGRNRKGVLEVLRPFAEDWDARMAAAYALAGIDPDADPSTPTVEDEQ